MKVSEAMAYSVGTASPQDPLGHVAGVMKRQDCGFVPVVDGQRVVGVVTDRDLVVRALAEGAFGLDVPVREVMTRDVWSVAPGDEIEDAAHEMARHHVRRLPVIDEGRLVGVLSYGDLEQALHAEGAAAAEATLGVT